MYRIPAMTVWSSLLLALLVACAHQGTRHAEPKYPLQPVQSPNDTKAYRYIKLDNGLRALLISDPTTEKAAAALDVYVGSASNPRDRGGLAHFLEHMLFLGTDKYPDSGEYATFISEHGGSRNAYTAFEHTNYFFDVDEAQFPEALDRFAQFFISPRFDAAYVDREVNAVEAEYQMGLNTDARRNLDVIREISNPDNPYSILGVGTTETLADRPADPVRDDLLAFYKRYYSANLMTLAVLGDESLDELQAMVTEIFSPIPNHNVAIEEITAPLIEPDRLPMEVYIQPEATARSLMISFEMPDYTKLYRAKPLVYIGNLIGHEGEGSLLSLLKAEGWAEGLGAGSGIVYRGGSAFNISISLTEQGLKDRQQVIKKVFEYIRLLQERGPQQDLYVEQAQLAELQFRFRENSQPMQYVTSLANEMQTLAPADVLQGNYMMTDYRPGLIQEILDQYFVPANALITVTAPGVPVDRESEFYKTPYSVASIDLEEVSWANITDSKIDSRLALPAPNEFIATDVEVLPLREDNPAVPMLAVNEDRLRVWQRQDSEFRIPKGALYTAFRTGLVSDTPADAAASQLYVSYLQDAVNEYTYPAYLAGLNFSLSTNNRGINLQINGYNDKQLVLLERIVDSIVNADLDNQRFDNIRKDLIRGLENARTAPAFRQVVRDARELLLSGQFDEETIIAELREMTPDRVAAHGARLWSSSTVDVLLNGNYPASAASAVERALAPLARQKESAVPPSLQVTRFEPGDNFVYKAPVEHNDSVMFWYLQAPDDSLVSRALAGLTGKAISANYFEDLRTDQQLGYVVNAFPWPLLEVPGVALMVQSPTASASDVFAASELFLKQQSNAAVIDSARFERHKSALLKDILQPYKNVWEESAYFWQEIARKELDFQSRDRLAAAVEAVSFEQWQAWYKQVMLDERASLLVIAAGQWGELPAGTRVDNPGDFREARPVYLRD